MIALLCSLLLTSMCHGKTQHCHSDGSKEFKHTSQDHFDLTSNYSGTHLLFYTSFAYNARRHWTYFWAQNNWNCTVKLIEIFNYLFGIPFTLLAIFQLTVWINLENVGMEIFFRLAPCNVCRTVLFMFDFHCNVF